MSDALDRMRNKAAQLESQANDAIFPNTISEIQEIFTPEKQPIYVYNISRLEFNVPRAPNWPHLLIRACPQNQPYALVGTLEHPYAQISYDQNGNKKIDYTNGFREATVMLSPMNPGTDQNFSSPDPLDVGGNLNNYGVFWSKSNPPEHQELLAARKRMEDTYKNELAILAGLEAKNPEEARDRANNVSHAAAEYYGRSYSWHRSDLVPKEGAKVPCDVCGELIQPMAKICVHCGAPTDEAKQAMWLENRYSDKRGPGRPRQEAIA